MEYNENIMWYDGHKLSNKWGIDYKEFPDYKSYRRACKRKSDTDNIKQRYKEHPETFKKNNDKYRSKNLEVIKKRYRDQYDGIEDYVGLSKSEKLVGVIIKEFLPKIKLKQQKFIKLSKEDQLKLGINRIFIDFYIKELNLCIEYQGPHHYQPVPFYKGDPMAYFEKVQRRDAYVKEYCKVHNIEYLEINGLINNRPKKIRKATEELMKSYLSSNHI